MNYLILSFRRHSIIHLLVWVDGPRKEKGECQVKRSLIGLGKSEYIVKIDFNAVQGLKDASVVKFNFFGGRCLALRYDYYLFFIPQGVLYFRPVEN